MAIASGGVDRCHISVFHRFFSRATWSLDALGRVVAHDQARRLASEEGLRHAYLGF